MPGTASEPLDSFCKPPYHRMVQAVAGAGKTTDLIQTFVQFCEEFKIHHARFPKIVLCTFTRKATLEIRERIQRKLLAENKLDLYFHTQNQNQIFISTIHGVFYQLLQQSYRQGDAEESKFDPKIQLKSAGDFARFKRNALRELIFKSEKYSVLLETFQFQQLLNAAKTLLELSLTNHIALTQHHLFQDVKNDFLHFQEIARKCDQLLRPHELDKWKLLCVELNQLQSFHFNSQNDLQAFYAQVQKFKLNIKSKPQMSRKEPELIGTERELYDQLFSLRDMFLKTPIYHCELWDAVESLNQLFLEVFQKWMHQYREHQVMTSSISFQDLEFYVLELMQKHVTLSHSFSKQWDYWMIDEYQDTSPLQNFVLNQLTESKPQFVVGDPQQSIYYFRGADQSLFSSKKQQMQTIHASFELKSKNHRSHARLIDSFNFFFEQRQTQTEFTPMLPYLERPSRFHSDKQRTHVYVSEKSAHFDDTDLAVWRCRELLEQGVDLQNICILAKNNSYLRKFTQMANQIRLPVQLYSSRGFLDQREVIDLVSYLKFLLNPHDDYNFLTLLRSPYVGLSDQAIYELCQHNRDRQNSLFETVKAHLPATSAHFLIKDLEESSRSSLINMAYQYVFQQGMIHAANEMDLAHQSHSNLFKLIDLMESHSRTSAGYWHGFFENLQNSPALDQELGVATPTLSSSRIQVMTIHAAKGLEFDHVILLGCDRKASFSKTEQILINEKTQQFSLILKNQSQENIVPVSLKKNLDHIKASEKAELERTFYVAITRAKETLTLCGRRQKSWDPNCYFQFVADGLKMLPNLSETQAPGQEKQQIISIDNNNVILKYWPTQPELNTVSTQLKTLESKQVVQPMICVQNNSPLPAQTPSRAFVATQTDPSAQIKVDKLQLHHLLAAQRGISLHKYLQSLQSQFRNQNHHFDLQEWINEKQAAAEIAFFQGIDFEQLIYFLWNLKEIPFQEILQNGHSEWSYEYINAKKQTIRGQIDLWGHAQGQLWIIDYKSGFGNKLDAYKAQLNLYEEALKEILQFPEPAKKIVLVLSNPPKILEM